MKEKDELQYALKHQESITTKKLSRILQALNFSFKGNNALIQRKKHGKPTVIHFQGRRFVHKERK